VRSDGAAAVQGSSGGPSPVGPYGRFPIDGTDLVFEKHEMARGLHRPGADARSCAPQERRICIRPDDYPHELFPRQAEITYSGWLNSLKMRDFTIPQFHSYQSRKYESSTFPSLGR
jgi:hypothetical protein